MGGKLVISAMLALLLSGGEAQDGAFPLSLKLIGVTASSNDTIDVEWLMQSEAGSVGQLEYEVHLSKDQGFYPDDSTKKTTVKNTSFTAVKNLQVSTKYYVVVVAKDAGGFKYVSNKLAAKTNRLPNVRTSTPAYQLDEVDGVEVGETSVTLAKSATTKPKPGEIISSTRGEGFLRKVVGVKEEGDKTVLETLPASLNEVYEHLEFSTNIRMQDIEDAGAGKLAGSVKIKSLQPGTIQLDWPTGLSLLQEGATKTTRKYSAKTTATAEIYGKKLEKNGDYRGISVQEVNGARLDEGTVKFPVNTSYYSDITICRDPGIFSCNEEGYYIAEVCKVRATVSHPDKNKQSLMGDNLRWGGNQVEGYYFSLNPVQQLVDFDLRPYKVDLEVDICPKGIENHVSETLSLKGMKIYVQDGDVSQEPKTTVEEWKSDDKSFTITNTTDIEFNPGLDIYAEIDHKVLKKAHVKLKGNIGLEQILKASASADRTLFEGKRLYSKKFVKVIQAGYVPIVVRGDLAFFAQIEGHAKGKLELTETFKTNYDLEYGVEYNDGWKSVRKFENDLSFTLKGSGEAGVDVTVSLIPELKLHFYEVVSGGMSLKPYLYGEASIEGEFTYQTDFNQVNTDADYSITKFEAGGGMDLYLYAGLSVFDIKIATYPKGGDINDVVGTWEPFKLVDKTKLLGIPGINAYSDLAGKMDQNTRAVSVKGVYQNVQNPLYELLGGKEYYIKFSKWLEPKLVTTESTCSGRFVLSEVGKESPAIFSFLPEKAGTCVVRLAGHSDLGSFMRQSKKANFEITDNDNDGMFDYWEDRYHLDPAIDDSGGNGDGDSYLNIVEYWMGTDPELYTHESSLVDGDKDGMQDNWEQFFGLNPNDETDASGDIDKDGITNLVEFENGTNPGVQTVVPEKWQQMPAFPVSLASCLRGQIHTFSIGDYGYVLPLGCGPAQGPPSFQLWRFDPTNLDTPWSHVSDWPSYEEVTPDGTLRVLPGTYDPSFVLNEEAFFATEAVDEYFNGSEWVVRERYKYFVKYSPATNSWNRLADFEGDSKWLAAGFGVNGKGYLFGGVDTHGSSIWEDSIWEYDTILNDWTNGGTGFEYPWEPTQFKRYQMMLLNEKAYLIAGNELLLVEYDPLYWLDVINPKTSPWSDSMGIYTWMAAATSTDSKGYILNGHGDFWEFNGELVEGDSTDSFTPLGTYPGTPICEPAAFAINNKVYFGFGGMMVENTCTLDISNELWQYTP